MYVFVTNNTAVDVSERATVLCSPISSVPRTPSTNVVVLSSDDILLYLDWTTLTSQCVKFVSALYGCQAAIVLPGETKLSDVPQLEEKGEALELLMTFVYPLASARSNTADTAGMSFESLMALARLGEKYEVYQALHGCRLGLMCVRCLSLFGCGRQGVLIGASPLYSCSRYIDTHALKILDYAGKHGYIDLATKAARKSVDLNLLYVQEQLEVSNFIRWVRDLAVSLYLSFLFTLAMRHRSV